MQMPCMQMQPMQMQGPPMAQPPRTSHTAAILASAIAFVGVAAVALVAVLALGGDESGDNGPVLTAATESQAAQVPAAVPTMPVYRVSLVNWSWLLALAQESQRLTT
jgi:hypothetical protein